MTKLTSLELLIPECLDDTAVNDLACFADRINSPWYRHGALKQVYVHCAESNTVVELNQDGVPREPEALPWWAEHRPSGVVRNKERLL